MREEQALREYLRDIGIPPEDIAAAVTLHDLVLLTWSHIYGVVGERMPLSEAAQRAGLNEKEVVRFTRALGFADVDRLGMTEAEVETLRLFTDFSELVGMEQTIHLGRVIGSSLARIAEATTGAVRTHLEAPMVRDQSYAEFVPIASAMAKDLLPRLADAMDRILRYHMLSISGQSWTVDPDYAATTMQLAVGFADMVGFTSRSAALSTADLAEVIDRFEDRVAETITSVGGRVVKFLGDEVLFTFADPQAACRCGLALVALTKEAEIPDVRVGLAYGEVITRFGDCYGPIVNVASRLVDIAPSGGIVVTPELASRATAHEFDERPAAELKGIIEPVQHLRLRR